MWWVVFNLTTDKVIAKFESNEDATNWAISQSVKFPTGVATDTNPLNPKFNHNQGENR
jgi:hypothetical protein